MSLDGNRIIVTGASSGIGRAAAVIMASKGARVMLAARRENELVDAVNEIRGQGGVADFCVVDVSQKHQIEACVRKVDDLWGGVDGVFANAGSSGGFTSLCDYSDDAFEDILTTNLKSFFWTLKIVLPQMIARKSGSILATGSLGSERGLVMTSGYNAAKHGVLGLVRSASSEVAPHQVRVNCLLPGLIHTPMLEQVAFGVGEGDVVKGLANLSAFPPQERLGTPQECAEVVAFLMSDASRYVNGQAWAVDGGVLGILKTE